MPKHPNVIITTGSEFKNFLPADGKYYSLEELQKAVGGYIEILHTGTGMCIVMDEEGKLSDKPINIPATDMLRGIIGGADVIVGDVVYCHPDLIEK